MLSQKFSISLCLVKIIILEVFHIRSTFGKHWPRICGVSSEPGGSAMRLSLPRLLYWTEKVSANDMILLLKILMKRQHDWCANFMMFPEASSILTHLSIFLWKFVKNSPFTETVALCGHIFLVVICWKVEFYLYHMETSGLIFQIFIQPLT